MLDAAKPQPRERPNAGRKGRKNWRLPKQELFVIPFDWGLRAADAVRSKHQLICAHLLFRLWYFAAYNHGPEAVVHAANKNLCIPGAITHDVKSRTKAAPWVRCVFEKAPVAQIRE
jgi:hypothetical protein